MRVQNNITAMNTSRQLNIIQRLNKTNVERLSTGYKINWAADDAAGLAISEKMRSQIRGLAQGIRNTEEGISLCHVADGALNEVHEMLARLKELSVQAATGTNCESDRAMIQDEVAQLLDEVDRIGDTTEFNTMLIFKGGTERVVKESSKTTTLGSIPFKDFALADLSLGKQPLLQGSGADMLYLQAIVNNSKSEYYGQSFNLIYGNGSTSDSSVRITSGGTSTIVGLENFTASNYEADGDKSWKKEYTYTNGTSEIGVIQTISIEDTSKEEKNYVISYEFTQSSDVDKLEFMFHADTAYNNNDRCEGYYIDGKRVKKFCVYDTDTDLIGTTTSDYLYKETPPESFSIVDVDQALAFSEKISFQSGEEPDSLSIGYYYAIPEWNYYNNLDYQLGVDADDRDLGFSLYYDLSDASRNNKVSFKYGIVSTEKDKNLTNISIKKDETILTEHSEVLNLWIQCGPDYGNGMNLTIGEMNTEVLGIRNLDLSTADGAQNALISVDKASKEVSAIRSTIGAQQNRLEHTILNNENILENTMAAESRIRDADMAKEVVENMKFNVLNQTVQTLLSQNTQQAERVLNLLQ